MRLPWLAAAAMFAAVALPARAADAASVTPDPPPSWSIYLRSSGYAYQTQAPAGAKSDHLDMYQSFNGAVTGLAGGRLTLRASGREARLPTDPRFGFQRSTLYTGYLDARLGAGVRARLGRQFLQSGVAALTLDGLLLSWGEDRAWRLSAWGGARSPLGAPYSLGSFDRDRAAGARLLVLVGRGQRLGVSWGYRERGGAVAERPVGVEYAGRAWASLRLLGRAAYDLAAERWARFEAQAQWRAPGRRLGVTVQAIDRRPSIDPASWLARFTDIRRVRLARGALRWETPSRFGGELEGVSSFVGARTSSRAGIALLLPAGRIGYAIRLGGATEEHDLYGEAAWQAKPWLRLEGEASYLVYALVADAPESEDRDLTTLAARAHVRLRPGCNLTAEVQKLVDPFYSHDVRLLVGVDLAMARGTSRFGIDRGGWLR